jgi:hypothetical protein
VKINAYPDKSFSGKVAYIYPTLKAETRTVPVRIELANPGGLLKPAMYASVETGARRYEARVDGADFGGDRQRHAAGRPAAEGGGALRAARSQARRAQRRLRRGARRHSRKAMPWWSPPTS